MPTWWHWPPTTPGCSAKLQNWSSTPSQTDSTSCKWCVCRARRRPRPSYASSSEPWRVCTHKPSKSWPSMTCWSCRDQTGKGWQQKVEVYKKNTGLENSQMDTCLDVLAFQECFHFNDIFENGSHLFVLNWRAKYVCLMHLMLHCVTRGI